MDALPYPVAAPPTTVQVGSYFVREYYNNLQLRPELVHRFYTNESSMVRVDADSEQHASGISQIHELIMSLNCTGIEIKTINSLQSWSGGVVVMLSGTFKSKNSSGQRNFVQTFFLAPQDTGYFLLNDIFNFVGGDATPQQPTFALSENTVDLQPAISTILADPPVSDYGLEVEASEYVNSVHLGDDRVDQLDLQEQLEKPKQLQFDLQEQFEEQQLLQHETAEGTVEEQTPVTESSAYHENAVDAIQEPPPTMEEPVAEPVKLSYASILRAPKGKSSPVVAIQPAFNESTLPASEWPQMAPPMVPRLNTISPSIPEPAVELVNENVSQEGESEFGESKSVYVRNLPSTVSTLDILQEFENFGTIKKDGVFIRNRPDVGVCYAFVEFEDIQSAQNAVKASPVLVAGRKAYIEERRANSSSTARGGRGRGRGRGGFGGRTFGRGSNQEAGDSRPRTNGFRRL